MKTNRILYPDGHRCSAPDLAATLPNGQYHLVTVGGHEYWIHRYEGALNGIDKAVVLLSYPKSAFGNKNALCMFVCSDCGLPDETILGHYTHRWKIEVMFKQQKCIWDSNPLWSVPLKRLTACSSSYPWHISFLLSFPVSSCL